MTMRDYVAMYGTIAFAALLLGCVAVGDKMQEVVKEQGEATLIPSGATNGQYVSAWALDPVDGAKAQDKGDEIVGFIGSADYRFLANDSKGQGYFMSDVVKSQGAFSWREERERTIITAKDFVSERSGLKYKWVGFRLHKSASPMLTTNPLITSKSDLTGTFRSYWQTVK